CARVELLAPLLQPLEDGTFGAGRRRCTVGGRRSAAHRSSLFASLGFLTVLHVPTLLGFLTVLAIVFGRTVLVLFVHRADPVVAWLWRGSFALPQDQCHDVRVHLFHNRGRRRAGRGVAAAGKVQHPLRPGPLPVVGLRPVGHGADHGSVTVLGGRR